jgi:hypothetical protein
MKTIQVYPLPCVLKKSFQAELPVDLAILEVMVYHGSPALFAVSDSEVTEKEKRVFRWYGNEEEITNYKMTFIGTILMSEGKVCLHLFEIEQPATGLLLPGNG